jgi:hypothetical protein
MAVGAVKFGFSYHDAGGTDGMIEATRLVRGLWYCDLKVTSGLEIIA